MISLVGGLAALVAIGVAAARGLAATPESGATIAVRGGLAAMLALVSIEACLGGLGLLTPGATTAALLAVATAALLAARRALRRAPGQDRHREAPRGRAETTLVVLLLAAVVVAFAMRLWAGLHKTTFLYDTLSYQLHAPVTWMHERRLSIVNAPFGDPAPAYAPSNLELWFLFLMAPLRSEVLAVAGQLPFAALGAAAIVAAVREAGGGLGASLAAALAFLLVPEIWDQAPTAMVDLGLGAFLLCALPFLFRLARRRDAHAGSPELLPLAAALGLAIGTKYVGLVLALPFALAAGIVLRRSRPRPATLALAGLVAFAAGGFWYLRNLAVTGNPIYPAAVPGLPLPALYDGSVMRAWDYHLPIGDGRALLGLLAGGGLAFTLAAAVALVRAWRGLELPIAGSLVALFWLAIPYQESRFLFPAFGVAAVALGRQAGLGLRPLGGGLLAVAVGGALLAYPPGERLRAGAGGAPTRDAVHRYELDDPIDEAWAWLRANVRHARVAYTGNNLPFPLAGVGLTNRVLYVNVAGEPGDLIHDFGRRKGARAATAEPAVYRDGAALRPWLRNLRAAGAQVLFVAALFPIVRRNVAADADGFPVERAWADADPGRFRLLHASPAARVYAIGEVAP